jgi:small subunit ribosomal protein S13
MPRISGVDIPDNKPVRISLRYLYGIGPKFADDLCKEVGIDGQMRANKLTEDEIAKISNLIEANHVVEGALRRQTQQNIARLRDIRCYRGDRHRKGLPVHGQRTKTNARTRKGKRKTVAGKKGVKAAK